MKDDTEGLRKTMRQIGKQMNDDATMDHLASAIESVLIKGTLPQEALNISDAMMEKYYAEAYRLYNSGKYLEASYIFRFLVFLSSSQPRYAMGLAACAHMLKDYDAAIKLYTICGIVDTKDPLAPFHASDCYIQKNDPASALLMLEMAVLRAGEKPEYKVLKDRSLLTMNSLKKEFS